MTDDYRYHAFEPYASADVNKSSCVRCGKPATDVVHATSVVVMPEEIPYLYNLVCDNPKVWNSRLRDMLGQRCTPTEAHNAKVELVGKVAT